MDIQCHQFSLTGEYHRRRGGENQDAALCAQTDDAAIAVLCDGATGCPQGGRAARLVCRAAARLLHTEGSTFFSYPDEKIAWLTAEYLLDTLEQAACRDGQPFWHYGCTFCMAYLQKATGRAVVVSLGDSAAWLVTGGSAAAVLPPRRTPAGQPPLTTLPGGPHRAMQVARLQVPRGSSLLLASDGFWTPLHTAAPPCWPPQSPHDFVLLQQAMAQTAPEDDCTCIALERV